MGSLKNRQRKRKSRSEAQLAASARGRLKQRESMKAAQSDKENVPCMCASTPERSVKLRSPRRRCSGRKPVVVELQQEAQLSKERLYVQEAKTKRKDGLLKKTQLKLRNTERALTLSRQKLASAQAANASICVELSAMQRPRPMTSTSHYKVVRVERRKAQRAAAKMRKVQGQVLGLQSEVQGLETQLCNAIKVAIPTLEERYARSAEELRSINAAITHRDELLEASRRKIRALQRRYSRAEAVKKSTVIKAVARARRERTTFSLMRRGVYTPQARALVRALAKNGCAQAAIPRVIKLVGDMMGVPVKELMSRRTVARAILEGGIAAEVQLGYEIRKSDAFTISGDGTTHRNETIESSHVAYRPAEMYTPASTESSQTDHVIRVLGITSAVDHTSETQFEGMTQQLMRCGDMLSESPLGQREGLSMVEADFALKMVGMNTDHANDQKKKHQLTREWKEGLIMEKLGAEAMILSSQWDTIRPLVDEAVEQKVANAGGVEGWNALSSSERVTRDRAMMKQLLHRIGKDTFSHLPENVQKTLKLFIWVGCAMHKELNSVKGGSKAMGLAWAELGLTLPVLLANKDNAATLELGDVQTEGDIETEAEQRAFEVSSRGGVKAASLAGGIFNHKDDKKGHQNSHRYFMRQALGKPYTFPDTSNTRFQSHCDAAADLLMHLEHHIAFLEMARDKKEKPGFNHMEGNVYRALQDPATLTELAVLALYAESVSHPYMHVVRGPGAEQVNALDLGPLHEEVKSHIKEVIEDPDLLLSGDSTTGTLDGKAWEHPDIVSTILTKYAPNLPHLRDILIAFMKGTLEVWERFTTEFAPGGLIDHASSTEREAAWMPACNDVNEGALGSYRLYARSAPNMSMHLYNALAMYSRNDTAAFMDAKFDDQDHKFVRQQARILDSSGLEAARRKAQVEFHLRVAEAKREKERAKLQKQAAEKERLSKISLVVDPILIGRMTKALLEDQLAVHRQWDVKKEIPCKSHLTTNSQRREALLAALTRYHAALNTAS